MSQNGELTQDTLNDDAYEELWICILNTKGRYELSKNQARLVSQALAQGERGSIMFETFAIPLAYVAEFYREKRYLKGALQLPARATESLWTEKDSIRVRASIQAVKDRINKLKRQLPEDNVIRGETPTATG